MRKWFDRMAVRVTKATGSPLTCAAALLVILVWAITGPIFHFSDTWQLVINTGTTIITFLMVFIIQATGNRDVAGIQAKLDEIIRALPEARNELRGIERPDKEPD